MKDKYVKKMDLNQKLFVNLISQLQDVYYSNLAYGFNRPRVNINHR